MRRWVCIILAAGPMRALSVEETMKNPAQVIEGRGGVQKHRVLQTRSNCRDAQKSGENIRSFGLRCA